MIRDERHTTQGMMYRLSLAETCGNGCRHLRCKAFLIIVLGVLFIASFGATLTNALLIIGVFLILLGFALVFMHYLARDMGKKNTTAGQSVNRNWNRIPLQRQRRRRNSSLSTTISANHMDANPNPISDEPYAPPPTYETRFIGEELNMCYPEPSDWTFLPWEPPPVYFPPISALDSNQYPSCPDDQSRTDQSELPVYSISRFTLPTYEQAVDA